MSAFASLLSSLQDGKINPSNTSGNVQTQPSARVVTPKSETPIITKESQSDAAILKRKASQNADDQARKAPKLSASTTTTPKSGIKKVGAAMTAKPTISTTKPAQPAAKPVSKPAVQANPVTTAPVAKRGFASLMAKAQAAQDAAKAVGPPSIKHKVTQHLTKKDRLKAMQEARLSEQKKGSKDHSKGSIVKSSHATAQRPAKQELGYTGTMRAKTASVAPQKKKSQGLGQDKYGGYASWSDLDDAEDNEDGYDSSDMEEAGFDDVMEEEAQAARIARQEDQRELEEEERHKKEKLERKKRLQALSDNAAAAKKRF